MSADICYISILGSTGSIGCNTLNVVEHLGNVKVVALAAGRNTELLAEQIARFRPSLAACEDVAAAEKLRQRLTEKGIPLPEIVFGEDGLIAAATHPQAETVVSATVGAVGFIPTLRAIEQGKRIALANKETLVMAGELMMRAAGRFGAEILPVDSEHNAIHQCLRGENPAEVRRIILTASGGPFRTKSKAEIRSATRAEALAHPNWKMGEKITIDSATLMNKGLEVIEARWLFSLDADRISVIIHPQSIVHSMVEMIDGSIIAQMGTADMRHAIQYALTFPQRSENCQPRLDLASVGRLDFEPPDPERFPCLGLAYDALKAGGTMPAVLNAANEEAVKAFLAEQIRLDEIAEVIACVMSGHAVSPCDSIENVLAADAWSRHRAIMEIDRLAAAKSRQRAEAV